MLRPSYYLTALIAALTTLIAVLAHSQPLPNASHRITPQTGSEPIMPVCYIQLENGQLRDLGRLCGKKATNPTSLRGGQRPAAKPDPDSDDDDSTSTATPKPLNTPSKASPASTPSPQPTSTSPASTSSPLPSSKPTPQPTGSALPNTPSRPASSQPSLTAPSTSAPSPSNPLAIPEDDSR